MDIKRRDFLKLVGASAVGAVLYNACVARPGELNIQSPAYIPEDAVNGTDNWYATLCPTCASREGLVIRVMEGRAKKVQGNPEYPVNLGKHSARCEATLQALYHPERLKRPMRRTGPRGSLEFEEISWNEAMGLLLDRLNAHRGSGTMVMVTDPLRGTLATVVDRFVREYGGQHMAFEPVEQVTLRQAMKEMFNQDWLPHFDIRNTRYLLSFGADFLSTWLSPVNYGVQYGQFRQGEGRPRGLLVQVDPRFSMSAANADQWLAIRPGTEGLLALSIAHVIAREGLGNQQAVQAVFGGTQALEPFRPEAVAEAVGLPGGAARIEEVARAFATQRPSLAIGGGSAAAHTNGLFNLRAIYALNFLVDSVGREGGIVFNPQPPVPELQTALRGASFQQWEELSRRLESGQPPVNLLITRGVDLVYGLHPQVNLEQHLGEGRIGYMVAFASMLDRTASMADLVLPERHGLEDWGDDVPEPGPGFQTVGFQQAVVNPLPGYEPIGFGDALLSLAGQMGLNLGMPGTMKDAVQETARKLFNLRRGVLPGTTFNEFWIAARQQGAWWDPEARSTAAVTPRRLSLPGSIQEAMPQFEGPQGADTFFLIPFPHNTLDTGRGANLPWLQAAPDPVTTATWRTWVEINIREAERLGIRSGDVVILEGPRGAVEALAYPHPAAPPWSIAVPLGQGHLVGQYARRRGSNVLRIVAPSKDRDTGALAWAGSRVRLRNTGRRERVPTMEGVVTPYQLEGRPVVQVTPS